LLLECRIDRPPEDSSPEEIVPLPVLDEDHVFEGGEEAVRTGYRGSVASPEYEREILQVVSTAAFLLLNYIPRRRAASHLIPH
jgi:hypothetical protein